MSNVDEYFMVNEEYGGDTERGDVLDKSVQMTPAEKYAAKQKELWGLTSLAVRGAVFNKDMFISFLDVGSLFFSHYSLMTMLHLIRQKSL